ncbi:MAG: DUF1905 domain-containing protein [Caldilineaceae bacterium]
MQPNSQRQDRHRHQVPDAIVEQLGAGKRPPVQVTIGSYAYRTTVAPMGGQFWIPLSAENRAGARISAGDELEVEIEIDTEPRGGGAQEPDGGAGR